MSFWKSQNEVAMGALIDSCASATAAMRDVRALEAKIKAQRTGYARALEAAKKTGEMPLEFQRTMGEDSVGRQVGIKVVALRELEKFDATHPLLQPHVRKNIATQTMINFNRADRPGNIDFADFAPSDKAAQIIFKMPQN